MRYPWTSGQDEIIRMFGYLGVNDVIAIIEEEYGIKRTKASVEKRASRIGVSLYSFEVCPRCGRVVKKLRRNRYSDGLCELCYQRSFVHSESRSQIMRKIAKGEKEDAEPIKAAIRARQNARKEKSNAKKRKL